MSDLLMEKDFGMALGTLEMSESGIRDYLEYPQFSALELPLDLFLQDGLDFFAGIPGDKYHILHCCNMMDRDLSGKICFLDQKLQKDFIRKAEGILDKIHSRNCSTLTFSCDMEQILADPAAEKNLLNLLHRLAPLLFQYRMTLLLPFRIPACSAERITQMTRFLRNSMMANVKLQLEIYPYDSDIMDPSAMSCSSLFYETKSLIFFYDADCGNRITKNIVRTWVMALDRYGFSGPFLLAPYSQRHRMVFPEAESFAKIISDLRNE